MISRIFKYKVNEIIRISSRHVFLSRRVSFADFVSFRANLSCTADFFINILCHSSDVFFRAIRRSAAVFSSARVISHSILAPRKCRQNALMAAFLSKKLRYLFNLPCYKNKEKIFYDDNANNLWYVGTLGNIELVNPRYDDLSYLLA